MVKNLPANAGDKRDMGSTPGSERSPGAENGNPLQYSCVENSMDTGAWQAMVYGVSKSRTGLSMHRHTDTQTHRHIDTYTHTHTHTHAHQSVGIIPAPEGNQIMQSF